MAWMKTRGEVAPVKAFLYVSGRSADGPACTPPPCTCTSDGRRNYNQLTRNAVSVGNGYPRVERRSVGVLTYPRDALCIALSPAAPHRAAVVRRISGGRPHGGVPSGSSAWSRAV